MSVFLYQYQLVPNQAGRTVLDAHAGHRVSASVARGDYAAWTIEAGDGEGGYVIRNEQGQTFDAACLWGYGTPMCLDCDEHDDPPPE